jgi:hypothetical protein
MNSEELSSRSLDLSVLLENARRFEHNKLKANQKSCNIQPGFPVYKIDDLIDFGAGS